VRLEHLADLELRYDSDPTVVRPFDGPGGTGYGTGTGIARGPALTGRVRWTNVADFRADDVGLPRIDGVISTDDGAELVVSLRGYAVPDASGGRSTTYAVTFLASDARYQRLNTVLAVAEATIVDPASMTLRARVFECVNEL
jgi:hypothetical protein